MKKLKCCIIFIFVLCTSIVGSHHEPWVDEAQSWLIARDASVYDIFFKISSYEGTFPLWFLTLKFFIKLGLTYEYLYIVPIIISTIGLCIFLTKNDLPIYIKVLLPFTYWIFYQYTIVARSYCYLFLAFSLLLYTYPRKDEKVFIYVLNLILFSFISLHGLLIATVLGGFYIWEIIKNKKYKNLVWVSIFVIALVFELFILFPKNDLYMSVNAVMSVLNILKNLIKSIIGYNGGVIFTSQNVIVLISLLIWFIKFRKNTDFVFNLTLILMVGFFICIRGVSHHWGILFLLLTFIVLINYKNIKNCKMFKFSTILIFSLYIVYSTQCMIYDLESNYSGAKEMANYIKNIDYENKYIHGIGYKTTSILPYFETCIYKNRNICYYQWSYNNRDWYIYNNLEEAEWDDIFFSTPDYILLGEHDISQKKVNKIQSIIESSMLYELEYQTNGYTFLKNYYSETEGFLLYKKISNVE